MANNEVDEVLVAKVSVWAIFGIVAIVLLTGSMYTIGAGQRGVLLTWGNPSSLPISQGFHWKIPVAQTVIKVDVQTQKYEADASAASSDLQVVSTKIAVNYHLPADSVVDLYTKIGMDYESKVIQPAVQETVKASTAQFSAEELITQREMVKVKIDEALKARLLSQGIYMETTSITNFDFSQQFNNAIEAKVTAEQNALTAKNVLAQRQYEAMQAVAQANGTAQSVLLQAEATAAARLVIAQAEAKALELQKEQAAPNVLELRTIEVQKEYATHWNGQLPTTVIGGSGAIPVLQLPSSFVGTSTVVPVNG